MDKLKRGRDRLSVHVHSKQILRSSVDGLFNLSRQIDRLFYTKGQGSKRRFSKEVED